MKKEIKLPNVWGQGALFAFSGLDGACGYAESLVGTLLGDRFGIQFRNLAHAQDKAYFIVNPTDLFHIHYRCVSSDWISADLLDKQQKPYRFDLLFVNQNTIVMRSKRSVVAKLVFDYEVKACTQGKATVYTGAENVFAFAKKEEGDLVTVAVSYFDDVAKKATEALDCDIDAQIEGRMDFYRNLPAPAFLDEAEERLYYKCHSILRSTVYTPQGKISYCALTPDRFPHRAVWLWDTTYLITGMKHISYDVAKQAVLAILQCSHPDGFLPHMTTPTWQSSVTQPPVLAWGAWELYRFGKDKAFLEEAYDRLCKYVEWDIAHRDLNQNGLPEWAVEDDPLCRCGESGMDNTPRFDEAEEMDCIDFASFLANDMRALSNIAKVLGKEEDAKRWQERFETIKEKINAVLWEEEDGFYYDRKLSDGTFHKVKSVASFLPLFAGVCNAEQAKKLVAHLKNPKEFATPFPIPSVSVDDKTYPTRDMFRGAVWLNFNYLIALGLSEYGFLEEATELKQKTIDTLKHWYQNDGVLYEFYDSQNEFPPSRLSRKGIALQPYLPDIRFQSVRDFSWGACAVIEFLLERNNRNPKS